MKIEEAIAFDGVDLAPVQFQRMINKMAQKLDAVDYKDVEITDDDVVIRFGDPGLPREKNVVVIGGDYYNKERQYELLKNVVPTIKTYKEYVSEVGEEFIAKKINGQKQEGQLDSTLPRDGNGYIFQPKVTIEKEFRVIVYYMNGKYRVSGIYEKTGMNASFKSINPEKASLIKDIAIKATKKLGYSFSGVDIALVNSADSEKLNEAVIGGKLASALGKLAGNLSNIDAILEKTIPVVLEVNSYPSMANPMIITDLIESIEKNVV